MSLKEIWERYGHFDKLLSDETLSDGIKDRILRDLWRAFKEELHKPKNAEVTNGAGAAVSPSATVGSETSEKVINPKVHYLKCESTYFKDVMSGVKTFEVRKNDRDFKVNDILMLEEISYFPHHLKEFHNLYSTGHKFMTRITYIFPLSILEEFYPEWVHVAKYDYFKKMLDDYVVLGLSIK